MLFKIFRDKLEIGDWRNFILFELRKLLQKQGKMLVEIDVFLIEQITTSFSDKFISFNRFVTR